MHSLEMINRMNCAKQVRKLRKANLLFNLGPAGHAKSAEKGFENSFEVHPGWFTEEQWQEERKKRKKSRRYS
jgi:hypothetical protein